MTCNLPLAKERLFAGRIVLPDGCWLHLTCSPIQPRGKISVKGVRLSAARWSAAVFLGLDIHSSLESCHKCKQIGCWNPDHLYVATHQQNIADAGKNMDRYSGKTHCVNGHPYDETTYRWKNKRYCRRCRSESHLRRRYCLRPLWQS